MHRECFLSVFKREVLHNATQKGLTLISEGNALVHGGDVAFDKRFFLGGGKRSDDATFTALYDLSPAAARHLGVLNFCQGFRTTSFRTDGCS